MTNEDKELIGRYMNWEIDQGVWRQSPNGDVDTADFDLNDVGLVVAEMQKRGEFVGFEVFALTEYQVYNPDMIESDNIVSEYIAWLFNAENFFNAFVEWRKK